MQIANLDKAIVAAAPQAKLATWLDPLDHYLTAYKIVSPKCVAAFLGQAAAEAGPGLAQLSEDTCYTHSWRLVQVFPREFPDVASTDGYVGNAGKIADRCYAHKLGNGDEASGDGSTFRGSGLFQLTGRSEIAAFAASVGETDLGKTAAWCRTPPGAAASACWYWNANNLTRLAELWSISAVTRVVNGPALLGNALRIAASNRALAALQSKGYDHA